MRRKRFKYRQPPKPFKIKNYLKSFFFSVLIALCLMLLISSFITFLKYLLEGNFYYKLMPLKDLTLIVIPFSLLMGLVLYQDD